MSTAAASNPSFDEATDSSRSEAWVPAVLCLVLGFSVQMGFGPVWIDLRPGYLLPLIALWWARRDGRAVVVPLGLLSLLPDTSVSFGFMTLSFGYADMTCLIAAGVALAFAPGNGPAALAGSVRPLGRWALPLAAVGWVLAAADRGRHAVRFDGFDIALDTMVLPAVVLVLFAVDWRKLSSALGRRASAIAAPLAMLVALGLTAQLSVSVDMLSFRFGSASASSLVPAACFVAVLCGWVGWSRTIAMVFVAAAIGQAMLWTVGPFSQWALGARAFSAPWMLLVQAGAAALFGAVFQTMRDKAPPLPATSQRALLAAALLSLLLLAPALNGGEVVLWGASLWGLAGASFLGGRRWGGRGAIGVPLFIVTVLTAVALGIDLKVNSRALASNLPTLVGVMVAYALGGCLTKRHVDAAGAIYVASIPRTDAPTAVDLSAVARVAQAVDHAAALRAFWALLLPAFALWQLAGLGVFVDFGLRYDDFGGDVVSWIAVAAIGLLVALWPIGFVVVDWMDRQDRMRVVLGVSGALLAFVGAAAIAIGPGVGLPALLEDAPASARARGVVLLLLGALTIAVWLLRPSHAVRMLARAAAAMLALSGVAALAWVIASGPRDERGAVLWQVVAATVAVLLLVAGWVRAVRLRMVLAEHHPRALLFGAVPDGRLWARIAALLGLPASMWARAALRQPSAWAFLLSRPLVYLGAAWFHVSAPGGLALIAAGHGSFVAGKRLAARTPWRPHDASDTRPPVLYLRSFEDDQFDFRRPAWQLRLR